MPNITIPAHLYQSFDINPSLDVPAEGYGGWKTETVEFSLERTALVSMHAWAHGEPADYPGLYRVEEYLPRAEQIARDVFPPLLAAARGAGMTVFHVVDGGDYYQHLPGYKTTVELAGDAPEKPKGAAKDEQLSAIRQMKANKFYPGEHNMEDIRRAREVRDFPEGARPLPDESIAENGYQLNALCREQNITHLIYIGFAINCCLLMSPGGMMEMSGLAYFCSTVRDATTAVEKRESARGELLKEGGLWRVSIEFGLVLDSALLISALKEL